LVKDDKILKVFFPIGSLYPSLNGGPGNTVYWLAKALTKMGIEVVCIATDYKIGANLIKRDTWLYTDYGKIRYTSDIYHSFPIKKMWYSIKEIYASDIVHLTSIFYPPSFLLAFVAIICRKKIVWSPRGELHQKALTYSNYKKKFILRVIKWISNFNINFHATSKEEVNNIEKLTGSKKNIFMIPNLLQLPPKLDVKKENTLLYLGRLHPIKAIDRLIIALSLSRQFLNSKYILKIAGIGSPEYVASLKECVLKNGLNNKIFFLGLVDGEEKETLLASSKWLILPSFSENFGNVVIEALAHGTPVIASTGTPWEILHEKSAGYWVENDANTLRDIIEKVINLEETSYAIMSENAIALTRNNFDVNQNIYKWVEMYTSLAKS
jgi:glycosyltransferase involved in cell wall biosynthesis